MGRSLDLLAAAIGDLLIDLADNVADLNHGLKINRAAIDRLKLEAPAIWQQMKARAEARRARLTDEGRLTPAAAAAIDKSKPAPPTPPAPRIERQDHGKSQGSLFR